MGKIYNLEELLFGDNVCICSYLCLCLCACVCAYICACVCMHLYIMHYRVRGSLVGPEADPGYWQRGEGGRTSGNV